MLEKKKISMLIATALLVAACGGGGGGTDPAATGGTETNSRPSGGDDASGGSSAGSNEPTNTGGEASIPSTDQKLSGYLELGGNALIYIPRHRQLMDGYASYDAVYLQWFETGRAFNGQEVFADIAAGLSEEQRNDPTIQVRPAVAAPAAPIASFGFRVIYGVKSESGGAQTGAQTAVGRVAFEFVERATTGGNRPERMTFIIDKVEFGTDANGVLVTARAQADAKLYVSGTNAQGITVNDTISAPPNSVRLMPLASVLDNYGDDSAQVLQLDLEQAFSLAGNRLAALHNLTGDFDMHVTMSSLKMIRPEKIVTDPLDPDPAWPRQDMVGKTIEMPGHAPVSGAGTSGRVWVRYTP